MHIRSLNRWVVSFVVFSIITVTTRNSAFAVFAPNLYYDGNSYYALLSTALADALTTIKVAHAKNLPDTDPVVFNRPNRVVVLQGGYDDIFENKTGFTTMESSLILRKGKLIVDRLIISGRSTHPTDILPPVTTINPTGGIFSAPLNVSLSLNEGGVIYYTTDGSRPNTSSSVYSGVIAITNTTAVNFFSIDAVGNIEQTRTATFTIASGSIPGNFFAIPRKIFASIVPYQSVDEALQDEGNIDWQIDWIKARAITLAYAAKEIQDHLAMVGVSADIITSDADLSNPAIILVTKDDNSKVNLLLASIQLDYTKLGVQGYLVVPSGQNIYIAANNRIGVLYGVYRLLEQIGFSWDDPYETVTPLESIEDPRSWPSIEETPTVLSRGFWIEGAVAVPNEFAVWMARKRFNLAGSIIPSIAHKLGIKTWGGGHALIQEEFSAPGLFDAHPEWFALVNGVRRPVKASGTYYNPSFANRDAAIYFADRMIERLTSGDLKDVDILNIWPTDSPSSNYWDTSPEAKTIGNETDNLLYFYSIVSDRFRKAYDNGVLSRPVVVGGISYYVTWKAPTNNEVLSILNNSPDYLHVFYLNERDWSDVVNQNLANRQTNREIVANLEEWRKKCSLLFGVVEYNNYSVYSAVGLSDMHFLPKNYNYFKNSGATLVAYMHPILKNPGPFRITNFLLSRMPWSTATTDPESAGAALLNEFYNRRYGPVSEQVMEVQSMMAESVQNAKEMFGRNSLTYVLFQKFFWAQPPYSTAETLQFISQYRAGGTQDLPALYSGRTVVRETFPGLNSSLQLQEAAIQTWHLLDTEELPAKIRARLDQDAMWIDATRNRYQLLAAAADYAVAQQGAINTSVIESGILSHLEFLGSSPVTQDTVSLVNQRSFMLYYQSLIGQ